MVPLEDCLPVNIKMNCEPPIVVWTEDVALSQQQTWPVNMLLPQHSGESTFQTGLDRLLAMGQELPQTVPTGLIFHASRSGANRLAAHLRRRSDSVVVGSSAALNAVFLPYATAIWPFPLDHWLHMRPILLDALIRIVTRRLAINGRPFVVKFASWNLFSASVCRLLWPNVPAVVMIREPSEIIVRHIAGDSEWLPLRNSPLQAVDLFRLGAISDFRAMSAEEYCARILRSWFQSALDMVGETWKVLHNDTVQSPAALKRVAAFLGIALGDESETQSSMLNVPQGAPARLLTKPAFEAAAVAAQQWAIDPYSQLRALESW